MLTLLAVLLCLAPARPVTQAETLAAQALAAAEGDPPQALAAARRALALTAEFQPTQFVAAGRRGEVVDDEFKAARDQYRRHRAPLYEAMGAALVASGNLEGGVRHLRRAQALAPSPERAARLGRGLLALSRGGEALDVLHAQASAHGLSADLAAAFVAAADAEGRASAQVEIDRARLLGLAPPPAEVRDGPLKLPDGARLSTGGPLRLDESPAVFYLASTSCRTCSEDLEELRRAVPADVRFILVPEVPDEDHALRQVLRLYRHSWPVGLGAGLARSLGIEARDLLVAGRRGWIGAVVKAPYTSLPAVLRALRASDVQETIPRPGWSRRPVTRRPAMPAPALLSEGFAPGDDDPPPPEFDAMVESYRAGRNAEALAALKELEAREDAWLLGPEARINRAILLARGGRRAAARQILLGIGDSRLADAADRALEAIAGR